MHSFWPLSLLQPISFPSSSSLTQVIECLGRIHKKKKKKKVRRNKSRDPTSWFPPAFLRLARSPSAGCLTPHLY
ncbi:hypothetical protein LY76DRAFT_594664 [Colletotrichum caudatum]|nr:hypothetical protein LY76DRAFT_594664 [Colletotrichum caudatum]